MRVHRRFRLGFGLPCGRTRGWLAVALLAVLCGGRAQAADALTGAEAARTIPIVDAHFHVMTWMDGRELLAHMDRNGVRAAGGVGGDGTGAMAQLGSRFIRPTGLGGGGSCIARWTRPTSPTRTRRRSGRR